MARVLADVITRAQAGGDQSCGETAVAGQDQVPDPGGASGDIWCTDVVATTIVNDRPVAVTGGDDKTVRVWDLTGIDDAGLHRLDATRAKIPGCRRPPPWPPRR